ncbi:MAG: KpsF/GutQ family sugar-phosphate isomerase [Nitrospinae bacterium]|nr:KpsF/GutQ family sugar-phosphate isomerase [Nitrospinota bacterium]
MDTSLLEEAVNAAARTIIEERTALARIEGVVRSDAFARAVTLCFDCKGKIFVIGLGKSGLVGAKIAATFSSTGTTAVALHAADALHGDMGAITGDDVAILISKSGETRETVEIIPFLRGQGNRIVALTNEPGSSLAKGAHVVLPLSVDAEGCPMNLAPMASTTNTIALGDALAAALMAARKFAPHQFARFHPGGKLGWLLTARVADMIDRSKNPTCWEGHLLREAVAVLARDRMGAVSIVDQNGRIKGIVTDGDLKRLIVRGEEGKLDRPVVESMGASPSVIALSASAAEALDIMERRTSQISALPVVDENLKPVGILRLHDVIRSHF